MPFYLSTCVTYIYRTRSWMKLFSFLTDFRLLKFSWAELSAFLKFCEKKTKNTKNRRIERRRRRGCSRVTELALTGSSPLVETRLVGRVGHFPSLVTWVLIDGFRFCLRGLVVYNRLYHMS